MLSMIGIFFLILAMIALLAAIAGSRDGKQGLWLFFGLLWLALTIVLPITQRYGPPVNLKTLFAHGLSLAIALAIVFYPMLGVGDSKSIRNLVVRGLMGAGVSAIVSPFVILLLLPE